MNRIAANVFLSLPFAGSEASKLALEVGERERAEVGVPEKGPHPGPSFASASLPTLSRGGGR
jgi:hypothetical protein